MTPHSSKYDFPHRLQTSSLFALCWKSRAKTKAVTRRKWMDGPAMTKPCLSCLGTITPGLSGGAFLSLFLVWTKIHPAAADQAGIQHHRHKQLLECFLIQERGAECGSTQIMGKIEAKEGIAGHEEEANNQTTRAKIVRLSCQNLTKVYLLAVSLDTVSTHINTFVVAKCTVHSLQYERFEFPSLWRMFTPFVEVHHANLLCSTVFVTVVTARNFKPYV